MPLDGLLETEVGEIMKIRQDMADWLEKHEWVQQVWHATKGACWVGSFYRVRGSTPYETTRHEKDPAVLDLIDRVFRSMGFSGVEEAVGWNDQPGRTKAEVIAMLRGLAHYKSDPDRVSRPVVMMCSFDTMVAYKAAFAPKPEMALT